MSEKLNDSTLLFRNLAEDVTARELAMFIERECSPKSTTTSNESIKVKNVTIPAPDNEPLGFAFVELFNKKEATLVLEQLSNDDAAFRLHGLALDVSWPLTAPQRKKAVAAAAAAAAKTTKTTSATSTSSGDTGVLRSATPPSLGALPWRDVPRFALVVALVTLSACFVIAKSSAHLPDDLLFVPISLVACASPERFIYSAGLSIVAALLLIVSIPLIKLLSFISTKVPAMFIWAAKISAVVTPLAMAAQAVVPLEETALLLLLPSDTLNSDIPQLQFQSAFHQGAASLFFMMGTVHVYSIVNIFGAIQNLESVSKHLKISKQSYQTKYTCLLILLLIPVSLVLHPTLARLPFLSQWISLDFDNRLLLSAFTQYACVGSLLAFFLSYQYELAQIKSHLWLPISLSSPAITKKNQ